MANMAIKPANSKPVESPAEQPQPDVAASGSPTEVYKLAYKYRSEKNIEGLKLVFSKDVLDFMANMGKDENKSLDDQIREMTGEPQWETDESRNEKISGDHATIEYRDSDGNWTTMDFVKEDGKWKLSLPTGEPTKESSPAKKR
jgi:hypothetical protein